MSLRVKIALLFSGLGILSIALLVLVSKVNSEMLILTAAAIVVVDIFLVLWVLKKLVFDPMDSLGHQMHLADGQNNNASVKEKRAVDFKVLGELYETLHDMAIHDPLTGLYNRTLFEDRLMQLIRDGKRNQRSAAIVLLDIDNFKSINASLGSHTADELLQQMASRLSACLRESDTLARLGGDEFVMILAEADAATIDALIDKMRMEIERNFQLGDHLVDVSVSIGIALYPDHGGDVETLTRHADIAKYSARKSHLVSAVYHSDDDNYLFVGSSVVKDLRNAIEHNKLSLEYQPIQSLNDDDEHYFEALVRWQRPHYKNFSIEEIIALAERNGLIRLLTRWVIRAAFQQIKEWNESGVSVTVSINLSMYDLHDPLITSYIKESLVKYNLMADQIVIEITETGIIQDARTVGANLTTLSTMGIGLLIDDFGTGQASMSYLKNLPVDSIKIDQSFVRDMLSNRSDCAIVKASIQLAHDLDMKVVAEGVEQAQVAEKLKSMGCDYFQGYHLGRPMPGSEVLSWLNKAAPAAI
ncbi:MAG: EAL domain-containing protein [Gammaproteobacteria bacterium]|nr:EAL domain-containing protein [Gammaproteobacteria bacterium]